jgi:hypothetical protein
MHARIHAHTHTHYLLFPKEQIKDIIIIFSSLALALALAESQSIMKTQETGKPSLK